LTRVEASGSKTSKYINVVREGIIMEFQDLSAESERDMEWKVEIKFEGDLYDHAMYISGDFKRENGKVVNSSLITKINRFCDFLGFKGGFNTEGIFVDEDGEPVNCQEKIISLLSTLQEKVLVYVYANWSDKKQKAYTNIHPSLYRVSERDKIDKDIAYMISKGYIKPYVANTSPVTNESEEFKNIRV